jgi:hypothetical protein
MTAAWWAAEQGQPPQLRLGANNALTSYPGPEVRFGNMVADRLERRIWTRKARVPDVRA